MKICILVGTRPEIIKMSPLIRECSNRSLDYFVLHTGQHYSYEMDKKFFEDLELADPKYNLNVGSQPYRKQVGIMVKEIKSVLEIEKPSVVIVQGDTISVLAGALAASKLGIKVAHHEAGLRSHDLRMLEETNRIITDHISDYLFAPTTDAKKNLVEEGLDFDKIHLVGNSVVDAVYQNLEIAERKSSVLNKFGLKSKDYILVTAHRAENVDEPSILTNIIDGLSMLGRSHNVLYPIHPRTKSNMGKFGINFPSNVKFVEPIGYVDFLVLQKNAKLVVTDSGGLQEESCILKVPCVTIRDNTERPETVELGMNIVSGLVPDNIVKCSEDMMVKKVIWTNPFGNGDTAKLIIDKLAKDIGGGL